MSKDIQVLFLDDEQGIINGMRRLFIFEPYDIIATTSPNEAREVLAKEKIKVVVSDYRMPEITGVQFLKEIKEKYPDVVKVLFTGYAEFAAAEEAVNVGEVYRFISKPWQAAELVATIGQCIEHYDLVAQAKIYKEKLESYSHDLEEKVKERTLEVERQKEDLIAVNQNLNDEINERKRAEIQIRESEEKYHLLYESSNDAIFLVQDGVVYDCNHKTLEMFACRQEDLIGKTVHAFSVPQQENGRASIEMVEEKMSAALSGQPQVFEWQHCRLDQSVLDTEVSLNRIDLNGKPILLAVVRDIAQRKATEKMMTRYNEHLVVEVDKQTRAFKQSEAKYRLIYESSQDAIFIMDAQSRLMSANPAGVKIFKLTFEDQIKGKTLIDFSPLCQPDEMNSSQKLQEKITAALKGVVQEFEWEYIDAQEGSFYGQVLLIKVELEGKELLQTTVRNITKQKQIETFLMQAKLEAEKASRLKSDFLANVSHEIRTPLNSIIGFTEIIRNSNNVIEHHEKADIVLRETDILLHLIDSILDHAKIEAGKVLAEKITFDLVQDIKHISIMVNQNVSNKGIAYKLTLDPNIPPYVLGDQIHLKQVLVNLLNNAVKFTHTGFVECRVMVLNKDADQVRVKFEILDSGIGIAEENQQEIFKMFTQADGSISRRYGGAGLGLNISKGLIELMGGSLQLTSELGKGSVFFFELSFKIPFSQEAQCVNAPFLVDDIDVLNNRSVADYSILYADDYPPNHQLIDCHLSNLGFKLDLVNNGKEAVEACEKKKYDLILMDIQMPEMDGYQASMKIRETSALCKTTKILAITAHAGAEARQACINAGMEDILIKPIQRKSFLLKIGQMLNLNLLFEKGMIDTKEEFVAANSVSSFIDMPMDYELMMDELGGNYDLLDRTVKKFLLNVKDQILVIQEAYEKKDVEILRKESHKIKGGAVNLSAIRLSNVAVSIDNAAAAGKFESVDIFVRDLQKEFDCLENFVLNGYK